MARATHQKWTCWGVATHNVNYLDLNMLTGGLDVMEVTDTPQPRKHIRRVLGNTRYPYRV